MWSPSSSERPIGRERVTGRADLEVEMSDSLTGCGIELDVVLRVHAVERRASCAERPRIREASGASRLERLARGSGPAPRSPSTSARSECAFAPPSSVSWPARAPVAAAAEGGATSTPSMPIRRGARRRTHALAYEQWSCLSRRPCHLTTGQDERGTGCFRPAFRRVAACRKLRGPPAIGACAPSSAPARSRRKRIDATCAGCVTQPRPRPELPRARPVGIRTSGCLSPLSGTSLGAAPRSHSDRVALRLGAAAARERRLRGRFAARLVSSTPMPIDRTAAANAIDAFLRAIGRDPSDRARPRRHRRACRRRLRRRALRRLRGRHARAARASAIAGASDGLVVVRDIPVTTMCPHHLLPASGTATIAMQTRDAPGRPRHARRRSSTRTRGGSTLQERIGEAIVADIEAVLAPAVGRLPARPRPRVHGRARRARDRVARRDRGAPWRRRPTRRARAIHAALGVGAMIAVVTGAGRGIGRAIAVELATRGCDVALLGRTARVPRDAAEDVVAPGRRALAVPCDVSSAAAEVERRGARAGRARRARRGRPQRRRRSPRARSQTMTEARVGRASST